MAAQAQRDVDAMLGETGSTMRAFQMADEVRRQIVDAQVSFQLQTAQEDFMRKEAEYNALRDRMILQVQQGLIGQQEYMNQLNQARAVQIQGYAVQIDGILANNQQLVQVYSADLEALRTHAQITYDAVNLEMGLEQATMDATAQAFEQYLSPLYAQLDAQIIALEATMQQGQALVDQATADALASQAALNDAQAAQIAGENPNAAFGEGMVTVGGGLITAGAALSLNPVTLPIGLFVMATGALIGGAGALAQK